MSYKIELQNNNIDLQSILNTVNSLPEDSGGSADIPTCTVTFQSLWSGIGGAVEYSKLVNNVVTHVSDTSGGSLVFTDVVCGTCFIFYNYGNDNMPDRIISGEAEFSQIIIDSGYVKEISVIVVNGDCVINLNYV